jgi:hypothetical protein
MSHLFCATCLDLVQFWSEEFLSIWKEWKWLSHLGPPVFFRQSNSKKGVHYTGVMTGSWRYIILSMLCYRLKINIRTASRTVNHVLSTKSIKIKSSIILTTTLRIVYYRQHPQTNSEYLQNDGVFKAILSIFNFDLDSRNLHKIYSIRNYIYQP